MKEFIILNATNKKFIGKKFSSNTQISKMVELPFTTEQYRCTMFNGVMIKLIKDNEEIIASVV